MSRYSRLQLADLSGVPARTIRYYHSLGVLPKPGRAGKEAVYTDDHLARLRDISGMQARGLRLDAIREVLDAEAQQGAQADWRAVLDPRYPGGADQSVVIDDDELTALLGDRRADILDELIAAQYVEREGAGWRIPDQPMLKGALILYDVGTDITLSGALRKLIRARIADLADEMVRTFRDAAETSYGGEGIGTDLSRFRDRFRAAAWEVGGATLADEIERAVRELDGPAGR
ncbi:MerR family transcriptional regulator [Nocardia puris]|uniref:MerR-like DNA binding protein n=1 Tax=Nocardia puris TaxID=208602 RepID=A0A366DWJ4_9NOCA|nr:MerR family transcriptional regulator [Nocardia puris]MBF6210482.1 MerR family transcriptional regulator [Nocardia puris]MBF6367557.1 MerR family transcriptional regulator [Nocardia puris]MBF6457742.1 MerR family transcriptional regulator [Nocardia puris]RBO93909.1 MerR-like DNA binding protein [Nocardia puris]